MRRGHSFGGHKGGDQLLKQLIINAIHEFWQYLMGVVIDVLIHEPLQRLIGTITDALK